MTKISLLSLLALVYQHYHAFPFFSFSAALSFVFLSRVSWSCPFVHHLSIGLVLSTEFESVAEGLVNQVS